MHWQTENWEFGEFHGLQCVLLALYLIYLTPAVARCSLVWVGFTALLLA